MALDFGKINFSVSFNPTSAFPLDARSYFESYAEAVAAAAEAVPAGSADSIYYYGQTLIVVENDVASFYIIQPNNTLKSIEGATSIAVNTNLFEYDQNGNLSLKGFDTAALGSVMSVGPSGTLVWSSVYTKAETDTKIGEAVAAASHLKRKIVDNKEDINVNALDADQYIYMIPTGLTEDSNKYNEYIVLVLTDSEGTETRFIEQVGSWDVDLSNYVTTTQMESALFGKVDKEQGSRLITETEINKLSSMVHVVSVDGTLEINTDKQLGVKQIVAAQVSDLSDWIGKKASTTPGLSEKNFTPDLASKLIAIEAGAEKNFVRSVSDEFSMSENGQLSIKSITAAQVKDLSDLLMNKAEASQVASLSMDVGNIKQCITWGQLD